MDFPPTARIDTRLTVIDWPDAPDADLVEAVTGVTTFELANDPPDLLVDGDRRHLAWRGYLTGGLLTLFERVGAKVSALGMSAFYGDPRLEVFVPAHGNVVVLGALRVPIVIERDEWDTRVRSAGSASDLVADLTAPLGSGAEEIIAEARRAAEEEPHPFLALRPEALELSAPGEVQLELLEDAEFELTERYAPEGSLDAAWLSFEIPHWRTDFIAPATVLPPYRLLEESQHWRVAQWKWVPDGEEDDEGEWELWAHMPVNVSDVLQWIPDVIGSWVRNMTELAIGVLEEIAEEEPVFRVAADTLKRELAAVDETPPGS